MTLATYDELKDEVASLVHREGDTAFAAKIPTWTRLFEARASRRLRVRPMEAEFAAVDLVDGAADLPADFRAFKWLRCDADNPYTLEPRTEEWVRNQRADSSNARFFAVSGSQVVCWPTTGTVSGTYFQNIPSLQANGTNWLLSAHPDVYLFGVLAEAGLWSQDTNTATWADRASQLLEAIQSENDANTIKGGPLTVRAR